MLHLPSFAASGWRTLLDKAAYPDFTVEIVRGLEGQDGFPGNRGGRSSSARLPGSCDTIVSSGTKSSTSMHPKQ